MLDEEDFDDYSDESEELNLESEDYFAKGGFIEDAKELAQKYVSKVFQNKCRLISGESVDLRSVNTENNVSLVMNTSIEDSIDLAHKAIHTSFLSKGDFLELINVSKSENEEEFKIVLQTNPSYCVRSSGENRVYLTLFAHPMNKKMANIEEYSDTSFESRLIIAILHMLSVERIPKELAGGLMLLYLEHCLGVAG